MTGFNRGNGENAIKTNNYQFKLKVGLDIQDVFLKTYQRSSDLLNMHPGISCA